MAIIPCTSILPYNATCFLKPTIWIHKLRPDYANMFIFLPSIVPSVLTSQAALEYHYSKKEYTVLLPYKQLNCNF